MEGGVRLFRKDPAGPKSGWILSQMEISTSRVAGLISDVMDFARARLGRCRFPAAAQACEGRLHPPRLVGRSAHQWGFAHASLGRSLRGALPVGSWLRRDEGRRGWSTPRWLVAAVGGDPQSRTDGDFHGGVAPVTDLRSQAGGVRPISKNGPPTRV
ncbi:hypothetical protein [Caulobacter sp.]|uniref:hypothetical protein n=1 Tax=Caulobacter sp. TaxID=78 RepID=UPI003425C331